VDLVAYCALNLLHHVIHELAVVCLEHANIVWRVNAAIPRHFLLELVRHISLKPIKEDTHILIKLALNLHIVDFGD